MDVEVQLFASLREAACGERARVTLPEGATVADLLRAVREARPTLGERLGGVRVARNRAFARSDDQIAPGDEIALIPPVGGG